ncbi:MAG: ParB/RepB/Spo0J family partition protein [Anaerofustis stercorihominis]|nr:ParB/RepB/Spo0J family partition protein [Anaerofustis stercorihominis]
MAKNSVSGLLSSVDDMFTTQAERDEQKLATVRNIPLKEISDFLNHPFKVKNDEKMHEMAESIARYGVINPVLVREKPGGGYEMISGHRRKMASELAGLSEIPCIIKDMTDDEAIVAMVDANLQRESVLPSEKAFAYKMKYDAVRRQAGRPSKNSATVLHNFDGKTSRELLAEKSGESHEQIRKYIRLTELIPQILDMVDEGQIALRPAVELSYLTEKDQEVLLDVMECELATPSQKQAAKLREFSKDGTLTREVMETVIREEKPNQKQFAKVPMQRIKKYFAPNATMQQIEDTLVHALDYYRRRNRDRER